MDSEPRYCANHVGRIRAAVLIVEPEKEPRPLCGQCAADRGPDHTYSVTVPIEGVCPHSRCFGCATAETCCRCQLPAPSPRGDAPERGWYERDADPFSDLPLDR